MLTPMDIHNKEFKRGFRGYSEEDVDAFMESIAADYEKVYREYCELKERCDKLQDKLTQYEKMESTMNTIWKVVARIYLEMLFRGQEGTF